MHRLKDIGLRLTPQRLAILEYFDEHRNHPSAEEIFREVKKKFPSISFATVYNTLEALKKRGKVFELTIDPERKRYDLNTEAHHHLICLRCRKVVDVHADYELIVPEDMDKDFSIISNHIEFYGICRNCMNNQDNTGKNREEVKTTAVFKCEKCGATRDGRCKPKKCQQCAAQNSMKKND